MRSFGSSRRLPFRVAMSGSAAISFAALLSFGCAVESTEDTGTSADELLDQASEAGIFEGSDEARAVLAVANDRALTITDYVYRVRISRKTALAIIAVRNGTNGENESRPIYYWGSGWGEQPPSFGDAGTPGPCPWGQTPPSSVCIVDWELGGDDEEFTRVSELDALPGTDVQAFKNLLTFARDNGYYVPSPVDGGPPGFPDGGGDVDGGGSSDGGGDVDGGGPSDGGSGVDGGSSDGGSGVDGGSSDGGSGVDGGFPDGGRGVDGGRR